VRHCVVGKLLDVVNLIPLVNYKRLGGSCLEDYRLWGIALSGRIGERERGRAGWDGRRRVIPRPPLVRPSIGDLMDAGRQTARVLAVIEDARVGSVARRLRVPAGEQILVITGREAVFVLHYSKYVGGRIAIVCVDLEQLTAVWRERTAGLGGR